MASNKTGPLISIQKALEIILKQVKGTRTRALSPLDAVGCVLAEDVISPDRLPRFSQSAMDGYAVRSEDTSEGKPVLLKVAFSVFPGDSIENLYLKNNEAFEITTGAPVPDGADAVIILEDVEKKNGTIEFRKKVKKGANIRMEGDDIRIGDIAAKKDTVIIPAMVGLFGALGIKSVNVLAPPEIGIITTGSELVSPEDEPGKYQIRDSNEWSLVALLGTMGIKPVFTKRFTDTKGSICNYLESISNMPDMFVLTGGVSVGSHDYVKEELQSFGVETLFWRVSQKPGKPFYAGVKDKTMFFGLPGNPAAVIVCFYIYIRSAIRKYMGKQPFTLHEINAELDSEAKPDKSRTSFIRARYENNRVAPLKGQDSHMLLSFSNANALIVLEPKDKPCKKGEQVRAYLLDNQG